VVSGRFYKRGVRPTSAIGVAHFEMLTFWDDIDAIKRFAGDDYAAAKYYDFDRSFLIELEPFVRHYTVHDE
jgi:hypothetical protein